MPRGLALGDGVGGGEPVPLPEAVEEAVRVRADCEDVPVRVQALRLPVADAVDVEEAVRDKKVRLPVAEVVDVEEAVRDKKEQLAEVVALPLPVAEVVAVAVACRRRAKARSGGAAAD